MFSSSGGYDFSLMDKGTDVGTYGRHLLHASINGRF